MGGLIPLLLPSGGGSRILPSDGYQSRRRASVQEPSSPLAPTHRRQISLPVVVSRTSRRPSISTSVQQLTVLPYTADEWKKTLSEVKQKYLNRKYRTCSARCCEILDNLKDESNVEPLHLVYLHFYAASSFEMCARPLSQSSTYRTKLLRDAREHYEDAAILIEKAEEITTQKSRSGSVSSTASHSPSLSLSSCMNASAMSPRSSMSSGDETPGGGKRPTKKKKKKVSFSGLPDLVEVSKPTLQPEPYLRPDSPTLGWEENYYLFGTPEPAPQQQQQQSSTSVSAPLAPVAETEPEPASPAPSPREKLTFPERSSTPAPPADDDGHTFNLELFLQTRSMNRLVSQLSALRSQIAYHRDAIEGLLITSEEAAEIPSVPEVPPVPSIPGLTRNISPFSASSSSAEDSDGPPTPTSTTVAQFEQHADYSPKTHASPGFFDLEAHMRRMEEQQQQQQQQQFQQQQHPTYFTMPDWNKGNSNNVKSYSHGRSQSSTGPYYIPSTQPAEPWMARPRSSDSNSSEATMTPSINARQETSYHHQTQIQRPASAASIARPGSTVPPVSTVSDEGLRDRIQRLRAGGWQRKRFDNRRYEALREQVLGELGV
ncbi:hypothetical protein PG993_000804 [Apiospora rasikravindrae]|uniref:Uncharacterized protein n=1 Tax=Apiospora rasikravindrae TaxID=990691 RepID=A0ABR1U9M1_9PEZI